MIIEFSVQNFGSIKEKQTLSFEATKSSDLEEHYVIKTGKLRLLKLAMIYGANASGKTTILKALDFLRQLVLDPAEKKNEPLNFSPFLFDIHTPTHNTVLSIDFFHNNVRYAYRVELNRKAIVNEELDFYDPIKASVYKRTTDQEQQFTSILFGGKVKTDKTSHRVLTGNTLWNNTVLGGFLKTNLEIHALKEVQDWFSNYLNKIIMPRTDLGGFITTRISKNEIQKNDVINILKKADFQISDILIEEEERDIPDGFLEFLQSEVKASKEDVQRVQAKGKVMSRKLQLEHTIKDNKYTLPFEFESQGTKRYYGFAGILALMIKEPAGFFIDELESSLHPDLYAHFIVTYLLNVKHSQLLFTTHNREILMNKDLFRNDAIWFTDKNEHCSTDLYSLIDFDSKVIRDTSNVYNAYKVGKLGGAPHLGDNYVELSHAEN